MMPRIAAAIIISRLLRQQGSLASLLPEYTTVFNAQENAFLKELCYGCCRWYQPLDFMLSQLLSQPLKKKESDIKAILLLGLYQLAFLRTAEHAAINESVNAALYFKKAWAKKLINAILRAYQRQQPTPDNSNNMSLLQRAQEHSASAHPHWLEKKIVQAWPEQAQTIFANNNQHPPQTLRINRQRISRDDYLALLHTKNIDAVAAQHSDVGIYLSSSVPVQDLPLFDNGGVSVQDEAAQLAANLLDLKPSMRVLDACCAPGGKTCHIGETQTQLAQLLALDVEPRRLEKVRDNIARINIQADIVCGDAVNPSNWWDGKPFDRILLDAPCSATGIIRRQPDIKLLRQPEHIADLSALQLKMLSALWPLLADEGILLYATCSILPEENTQVIERFTRKQLDAWHQVIQADWGIPQDFGRQLLPGEHSGHDGFYYALLKKVKK